MNFTFPRIFIFYEPVQNLLILTLL